MKRSPLKRKTPLRSRMPLRSQRKRVTAHESALKGMWHDLVMARGPRDKSGQRVCAVTGQPAKPGDRLTAHHVIERGKLRDAAKRLGLDEEELLWDWRCGMVVLWSRHERHTSRKEPIPFSALSQSNLEFAEAIGLTWYVEQVYPA